MGLVVETSACTFFLSPHLQQLLETLIVSSVDFQRVQCLSHDCLRALVSASSEQFLDSADKCLIKTPRECRSRVVAQYPDQHDRIVLHAGFCAPFLGQELADLICTSRCCRRRGLGTLNNGRQVDGIIVWI